MKVIVWILGFILGLAIGYKLAPKFTQYDVYEWRGCNYINDKANDCAREEGESNIVLRYERYYVCGNETITDTGYGCEGINLSVAKFSIK